MANFSQIRTPPFWIQYETRPQKTTPDDISVVLTSSKIFFLYIFLI